MGVVIEKREMQQPDDPLWQVKHPRAYQQNIYLLESGVYSDCVFIVGEEPDTKKFHAHKLLLAKVSPVFGAMLFGPLAEKGEIRIKMDPDVFQAMLEFVYKEDINSPQPNLIIDLIQVADMYNLPGLMNFCVQHLINKLTPEIACQAFYVGEQFNQEKLKQNAWKMITQRTNEVLASDGFQNSPYSTVLAISVQEELNCDSEAQLINKCFEWGENEVARQDMTNSTADLRQALGDIVGNLRFLCLTLDEFAKGPAKSNVLTDKEKITIQIKIASQDDTNINLPYGFYNENKLRAKISTSIPKFKFTNGASTLNSHSSYNTGSHASLCFKVDNNILLLGIVVPPNTAGWEILVLGVNKKHYYDTKVAKTEANGAQIFFKNPICIQNNDKIKVIVTNSAQYNAQGVITSVSGQNMFTDPCIAANPNQSLLIGLIFVKC